jgi:uncharacterized membrane protein
MGADMENIDRAFVTFALILALIGMFLGLYIGATNDFTYLQTHVGIMLNGFLMLATFGAIYRLWPAMKVGTLPKIQFWLAVVSTIVIIAGAIALANQMGVAVIFLGSVLTILSAGLLLWLFWTRSGESG